MSQELMAQFLVEGRELVAEAARGLSALALQPGDAAAMEACFRALHTLKGSTGLFDLEAMGRLLHAAEDRLTAIRDGAAGDLDALVAMLDQVDRWLDSLERHGRLPADATAIGQALAGHIREEAPTEAPPAGAAWTIPAEFAGLAGTALRYVPREDCFYLGDDPIAIASAIPRLTALRVSLRAPWDPSEPYDPFTCNLVVEAVSAAPRAEVEAGFRLVADQVQFADLVVPKAVDREAVAPEEVAPGDVTPGEVAPEQGGGARRSLRVDAARLDRLAALADDLVIAKAGLAGLAAQVEALPGGHALGQALRARQARLDRLAGDLHATIGRVRLVPLAPLFARFPRLVRDIAGSLSKIAALEVVGGEVEVDKAVVDALADPLLHVLRNALDHGIEDPARRRRAGKPEAGQIRLAARVDGDQVVIEVTDDGAGIDPVTIRDLALQRGLLAPEEAARLDDAAAIDLIFAPGFSTAASVTTLSGRGVGMDVVRSAAAGLGGKVAVTSTPGQGTQVQFRLPLAMALVRILVVACGTETYGLPLDAVVETARLTPDRVVPIRSGRAFQLRDQVLPLVRLADLVGAGGAAAAGQGERVVIATVRGQQVGFAVDAFVDRMDAALRPMGGLLAQAPGLMGTTLLADGGVLMVLDLAELVA
ncbi:chemotaxis protein CheA [Falsiroseomonas tokyonensis]|uniref:Chemotaxis protein CheA n=1 Tax=Falsiroseomonas tokyonensis TaxID=430521 RepID=A0ABV7C100_9PROT|nr:chemotaxis protein CheA [Falsiroseomonas tokyonensis]MBU8540623.1 chemotaxis protein CheA [Falsiroseomonas tokyonensis]